MNFRFNHHYSLEEARALLPQVRQWLNQLNAARKKLTEAELRISPILQDGGDAGGPRVAQIVRATATIKELLGEFSEREIQLKDIERGLIDFPSIRDGREIFLCWEQDEDDIEFWHELDTGYAGRHPL